MSAASPLDEARAQALRLLVAVVTVVLVAVASGILAGRAVWAGRPADDAAGWSDLSFAIGGLLVGFVVAGFLYLVGLVVAVHWALPRGCRLGMYFAVLAVDAMLVVALSAVARAADQGGMPAVGTIVAAALVTAAIAGLGLLMQAVRTRTAGWIGGVAGAGVLLVVLVGGLRADSVAASERAARYEATGAPLALVDGRDLSVPADGWELAHVDQGWSGGRVTATFDVSSGGGAIADQVRLDLDSDPDPRPCAAEPEIAGRCVVVGRATPPDDGAAGGEIVGERIPGDDGGATFAAVWVDVPGGRWTIWGSDVDEAAAVAVLRSLVPVDAVTFAAGT